MMRVAIVGSGYVGLTTGVALAYLGFEVCCVDADEAKVASLRRGQPTIFEPGLAELMAAAAANLRFTTEFAEAIPRADVVFLTVGTPATASGAPDMQFMESAATSVGELLDARFVVIVNKSTVPVGSGNWVEHLVRRAFEKAHSEGGADFAVASNPEFLREGSALHDTFFPDRVVVGSDDPRAVDVLTTLYRAILDQSYAPHPALPRPGGRSVPLVQADLTSAELIKYAANAFLATKISFINEVSELSERVGADIRVVARAIGLDTRIGAAFLQAGLGWGGSCFGKDTAALEAIAAEYRLDMPLVHATRTVNERQRQRAVDRLLSELRILKGKTIAILGIAFKPGTDDIRDAPALDIGRRLLARGASVRVHDPVAVPSANDVGLEVADSVERATRGADAVLLATEWPQYRAIDWGALARQMRGKLLVDGRNFLVREEIEAAGLRYVGVGI